MAYNQIALIVLCAQLMHKYKGTVPNPLTGVYVRIIQSWVVPPVTTHVYGGRGQSWHARSLCQKAM